MKAGIFKTRMDEEGLKSTRQREEIVKTFLKAPGHQSLEQIYSQVIKTNPKIGRITVYRTLKLLTRLGLAIQRKFADGETRYELASEGAHHDHLICLDCGKIIEFEDPTIESLQARIAQQHQFQIFQHRMELYGRCETCLRKKNSRRKKS